MGDHRDIVHRTNFWRVGRMNQDNLSVIIHFQKKTFKISLLRSVVLPLWRCRKVPAGNFPAATILAQRKPGGFADFAGVGPLWSPGGAFCGTREGGMLSFLAPSGPPQNWGLPPFPAHLDSCLLSFVLTPEPCLGGGVPRFPVPPAKRKTKQQVCSKRY